MGLFLCEVHGPQGFIQTCRHVGEAIRSCVVIPRKRILGIEFCDACWARHEHERVASKDFSEWGDEAGAQYALLSADSMVHCVECIAATELAFARARGQVDPFPAYERTLTYVDREAVQQLEATLLGSFHFRQSVVDPSRRALWVRYGALTCPLIVTIYYVIDRTSQDHILAIIDAFLSNQLNRQYRCQFYRSENWTQYPRNPNAHFRGPEELIREYENDSPRAE